MILINYCYRKGPVDSSNNNIFCGGSLTAPESRSLVLRMLRIPPSWEGGPTGTPTLKLELCGECRWFKWEFRSTL